MDDRYAAGKTAIDYDKALEIACTLLGIGLSHINHPVAKIAAKVIPAIGQAAPKVAPIATDAAAHAWEKAPAPIKNASKSTSAKVDSIAQKISSSKELKSREKARKEARRVLLASAAQRESVKEFLDRREADSDHLSFSGVYAILRFEKGLKGEAYENYSDIYVCPSPNIAKSIEADLAGKGNANVYADYKYKQDLHILVYLCSEEDTNELAESIQIALDADCSYNAIVKASDF